MSLKNTIIKHLLKEQEVVGIEILQYHNCDYVNNIVSLQQERNQIKIIDSKIGSIQFTDIQALTFSNKPVFLVVNLRNILHKTIEGSIQTSDAELIKDIFPNASLHDFYIQKEPIASGRIVSIIRRDLLDSIIHDFTSKNIDILGISLGSWDVQYIKALIPNNNRIFTNTHQIDFNKEHKISEFTKNTEGVYEGIELGDELIDSRLLSAYSGAFKTLLQVPIRFNPKSLDAIKEDYLQKKLYQKASIIALLTIFLILIVSTAVNYHFKDKANALQSELSVLNTDLTVLDSLRQQVAAQRNLIKQTNITKNSRTSFYADRIAASIPNGLELIELKIFPVLGNKKDYRDNQLMKFQNNTINIKGYCDNSITYNEWIKQLQNLTWVKSAQQINYKDINTSLGEFEIKLIIAL